MSTAVAGDGSTESHSRLPVAVKIMLAVMSGMLCGSVLLTLLGIAIVDLFVVPKFAMIFEDFDTEMPATTLMVLQTPRIAVVGTMLLLIVLLVVKEIYLRHIGVKLALNVFAFLLTTGVVLLLMLSLFEPLVAIMQSEM